MGRSSMSSQAATEPPSGVAAYVPRVLRTLANPVPSRWETAGTMLFADISGFTRLTERLARQGKVGAEEVVTSISRIFEGLLCSAGDDPDVLKFGGDALVMFFDGPDHARRACHSALRMQRRLGEIGRVEHSSGMVRLRMSVGVHTGRFHFFLCGGEHLELHVLGQAVTTMVAAEETAEAGQVLVTPATAEALVGARFGPSTEAGSVVRSVPPPTPCPRAEPTETDQLDRLLPPPLRGRLDHIESEHRRATVAFAQFGGIDLLLAESGPAEAFSRVQALTAAVMEALETYGVLLTATDIGTDGGKFMMTAGVPDATGDEEARMLRVARAIVEADCGLAVRIGVNTGNVFVGAVGAIFRRTYATMGDTTNLAARMMGRAPWGGVLATNAVLEPVRERFDTDPVAPLTVKGKARPVSAELVRGTKAVAAPVPAESAPLVGRRSELKTLTSALAEARAGRGRVVELVGVQGVGKTRLVNELAHHAEGFTWIATAGEPFEQTSPFYSARTLLRRVLSIPADTAPDAAGALLAAAVHRHAPHLIRWLPLIAVPVGASAEDTPEATDVAPRYRRNQTNQVVAELLEAVVSGPAVLMIDDASLLDDASAELIAGLLGRISVLPWLGLVVREEDRRGLHSGRGYDATLVELGPLDGDDSADLARWLAEQNPVPPHLLPEVVERAAGNPLFLAQLVAAQTASSQGERPAELPHSVEAIVATRIDALRPDDRRALRYLSVLGDRITPELLDATLGELGISRQQADRWSRLSDFIVTDENQVSFRTPLVRQVAYEALSYARRRELHGRVADALAGRPERRDQLPLHLYRAERWGEAWVAAVAAGDRARLAGANAVAGELYDMALTATRHLELPAPEVHRVARCAGEVWEQAGVAERALAAFSLAVATSADPIDRLLTTGRRAGVHESAGRYPQALRLYHRALTDAAQLPPGAARSRCLARLHAGYASTRLRQGRLPDAINHALAAAADAEAAGDRETLAYTHHLLDRAYSGSGDRDAAAHHRDAALPLFAELGDLAAQGTVLHDLGDDAQRLGRLDEARWMYEQSRQVRTRAGDVVRVAASINALGEVMLAQNEPRAAGLLFSDALRMWRGTRSPEGVAVATSNLGAAWLDQGRPQEALSHLEESRQVASAIGAAKILTVTKLRLARVLASLGRWVEAWEAATDVLGGDAGPDLVATARKVRAQALAATGGNARAKLELEAADPPAARASARE